jgi:hypothetical protein
VENFPTCINLLSYLFVVVYMFSVPLETTRGEIMRTFGDLNLMERAFLANFVIISIFGIVIGRFFDLPPMLEPAFSCSPSLRADCSLYSSPVSPKVTEYLLRRSYLFSVCWQF